VILLSRQRDRQTNSQGRCEVRTKTRRKLRLFFDLDDTLIDTGYAYFRAEAEATHAIVELLGEKSPPPSVILRQFKEVDRGYSSHFDEGRFARVWCEVYRRVCHLVNIEVALGGWKKVRKIALSALESYSVKPPAKVILGLLKKHGHVLTLWTMGPIELQTRKALAAGLLSFFESVICTRLKNATSLRCYAGDDPVDCVVIGDSIRYDIRPAIDIGARAIYLRPMWSSFTDEHDADFLAEFDGRVKTASALEEVPGIVEEIACESLGSN